VVAGWHALTTVPFGNRTLIASRRPKFTGMGGTRRQHCKQGRFLCGWGDEIDRTNRLRSGPGEIETSPFTHFGCTHMDAHGFVPYALP
jgi:hypothetical protein